MSDSPRPSEMSLSIKIGEHAVDVAGPIGEVWKVLEVFQRLSGFDPHQADRDMERRIQEMLYAKQMQPIYPPYIVPNAGGIGSVVAGGVSVNPTPAKSSQIDAIKKIFAGRGKDDL